MGSTVQKHIKMVTTPPGPKSKAVLERIAKAVPRAVTPYAPVVAERSEGSLVTDLDGNTFIDLIGGLGVLNVGQRAEGVVAAVHDQVDRFIHTDFAAVPYENFVRLAERLNARFPGGGPARSTFFNSGAEAVENAVKIAKAATGRRAVIAFEGAFHGRTHMAMTLTAKAKPYKAGFGPLAPEVYRAPFPYPYRYPGSIDGVSADAFYGIERVLHFEVDPQEVAAVIVEPVQGEGGFIVPPMSFLPYLRELTSKHGILLIVDEVQSGFGRTGKFFATEHTGIRPDLVTVAKSLADGLPLSAVIGRDEIMQAPVPGGLGGTFAGNPVACAAAGAVLDAFERQDLLEMARRQGEILTGRLRAMADKIEAIGDVRGLGAMVAAEIVRDKKTREPDPERTDRVLKRAMRNGVLMIKAGLYGNVIRFLAPLTTPEDVLAEAMDVLEESFAEQA